MNPPDLRPLDHHFGQALARWAQPPPAAADAALLVRLGARLSAELGRQNVCLELARLAAEEDWPPPARLIELLRSAGLLTEQAPGAPLTLDDDHLYLTRFHRYEVRIAEALATRAGRTLLPEAELDALAPRLAALFPQDAPVDADGEPDWQRIAAATALDRALAVIAGGPGTGKTTTVARLLVLLLETRPELRVRLAAPTGKAAARLTESIRESRQRLQLLDAASAEVLARLPDTAETLHRLLGYRAPDNLFRFGADQRLAVDLVVVDEASMVDLRLMAQLLDALPPTARLVLLGDKDQLSSVEAGRVLGDLCAWTEVHLERDRLSTAAAARLGRLTGFDLTRLAAPTVPPLADGLCLLRRSHRFDASSALGRFAEAVNGGEVEQALTVMATRAPDLLHMDPDAGQQALITRALEQVVPAVELAGNGEPGVVLDAHARFQMLCSSRHGPVGVERLNALMEQALRARGLIRGGDPFWCGRPVMVTVNDYTLGLFNGDVGVILRDGDGVPRAWFIGADRELRSVRATRLPRHETALAMTVHKSQGSEFDRVLVVLGEDEPRLLTRELLYTAVTRARAGAAVFASTAALRQTIATRSERSSGLRRRLWGDL